MDACDVFRECYRKVTDEDEYIHFPRLAYMIFEVGENEEKRKMRIH